MSGEESTIPTSFPAPPKPFVKEFDAWSAEKKFIETKPKAKRMHPKVNEVWHVKFGVNSWTEVCWKDLFLRPAMILSVFKEGYFVVPLTKQDLGWHEHRYPVRAPEKLVKAGSCVLLNQAKYVSWHRIYKPMKVTIPHEEAAFITDLVMKTLFPQIKNSPDSIAGFGVRSFEEEASED